MLLQDRISASEPSDCSDQCEVMCVRGGLPTALKCNILYIPNENCAVFGLRERLLSVGCEGSLEKL
jgi:hypothetical protein